MAVSVGAGRQSPPTLAEADYQEVEKPEKCRADLPEMLARR